MVSHSRFSELSIITTRSKQQVMELTQELSSEHSESVFAADNPNTALVWPRAKKIRMLCALMFASLLCDWGMTWGTTLFEAQAQTWKLSIEQVANSISGGIFLQGVGGLLAVPLTQRHGRLPVLFWSQLLTCSVIIGAALSPSYAGFTACRALQGLFNTAPQVIGLSIIHDMYEFEERARKINLWAFSFLCGPFLGPFISAFLIKVMSWRLVFVILAGLHALSLSIVVLFADETIADHQGVLHGQRDTHRLFRLIGSKPPPTRPSLPEALRITFKIALFPHLFMPTAIYTCINFMWAIGIITTITQFVKPPPYLFSDNGVALIYLGPFLGALTAEIWGHFFNDYLQRRYMRSHNGNHLPENRLWAVYPSMLISTTGLVLYGMTLQYHLHWIGLAAGWAMIAAGFLVGTTAISAYVLDCFQDQATAASSWINFWRTTGGFCVSYFQLKWVQKNGAAVTFGCQAGILIAASAAIIATHVLGRHFRARYSLKA